MHILVKKLLIFSVFILLCATQATFGAEKRYRGHEGSGTHTITVETDSNPPSVPLSDLEATKGPKKLWWQQRTWKWYETPALFMASLFDPFIQDAPKVLGWAVDQKNKMDKLGDEEYLVDAGTNIAQGIKKAAQADPLEFTLNTIIYGGAFALGYADADYSTGLLPILVGTASGIKQSELFFAVARTIESKSTLDTAFKLGAIAVGVYCVASVPCAAALETITLGTQYQVTTTADNSQTHIASTSIAGTAFGVWLDPSLNVVGCTLNSTAPGTVFTLSASSTSVNAYPDVTCSTVNPLCIVAWPCGANICVRPFNPFTQTLSPITNANTIASTSIGRPGCTRFSDGTLGIGWGSSSTNNDQIWERTYSGSTGTALTTPVVVNLNPTNSQGSPCITGLATTPSTALLGWVELSGTDYILNQAVVNTASGTINSTVQTFSSSTASQQSTNCFTSNGEGRIAWLRGINEIHIQRVATSGALIGSDYLLQLGSPQSSQIPVGLETPDGNAFITSSLTPAGYPSSFKSNFGGTFAGDASGTPQSSLVEIPFNPVNQSQGVGRIVLLGGTPSNYNVGELFSGSTASGPNIHMQFRSINIQGGSSAPTSTTSPSSTTAPTSTTSPSSTTGPTSTTSPSSTTGPTSTTSPSSTTAPTSTTSPSSTTGPTSAGGRLEPGMLQLPSQLIYHSIYGMVQVSGWIFGKLFG